MENFMLIHIHLENFRRSVYKSEEVEKKKWVDKNSHAICLQCRIKNKEGKQMRVYKEKEMWKRIQIMEYSPRVDIFLSLSLAL